MKALAGKLEEMKRYIEMVISGQYRYNHDIIQNYQVSKTNLFLKTNFHLSIGYLQPSSKPSD